MFFVHLDLLTYTSTVVTLSIITFSYNFGRYGKEALSLGKLWSLFKR